MWKLVMYFLYVGEATHCVYIFKSYFFHNKYILVFIMFSDTWRIKYVDLKDMKLAND